MKKFRGIIMSILISGLCASYTQAQDINVGLGVKAGATYSQYIKSSTLNQLYYKDAFGYTGGVFIPVGITEKISVQPELLITYRTFESSYYSDAKRYTLNNDYYFLDIPLVGRYQVIENVKAELGASASFLLNAGDITIEDERGYRLREIPELRDSDYVRPTYEQPRDWSFSALAGAYYQFNFGLEAGARVSYQFTEAYEYNRVSEKVYPLTYQLLVSYRIPYINFNF